VVKVTVSAKIMMAGTVLKTTLKTSGKRCSIPIPNSPCVCIFWPYSAVRSALLIVDNFKKKVYVAHW